MKINRLFFSAVIAAAAAIISACEPEAETVTKDTMVGDIDFDLPAYIQAGEERTLSFDGIIYPETYVKKWTMSSIYKDTLLTPTVKFAFPADKGSLRVTAIANADGFYAATLSKITTIVDTTAATRSLEGQNFEGQGIFTDGRDGRSYHYTTAGSLNWMSENLAYGGAGITFMESPIMDHFMGRFYTWEEATAGESGEGLAGGPQGICPEGWSVPTNADWIDLASAINPKNVDFLDSWAGAGSALSFDAYFNGKRYWPYSPDNEHLNAFGWNALPCGYVTDGGTNFQRNGLYGMWWSSSDSAEGYAYLRYIYSESGDFPAFATNKSDFAVNVRCVRLAQ